MHPVAFCSFGEFRRLVPRSVEFAAPTECERKIADWHWALSSIPSKTDCAVPREKIRNSRYGDVFGGDYAVSRRPKAPFGLEAGGSFVRELRADWATRNFGALKEFSHVHLQQGCVGDYRVDFVLFGRDAGFRGDPDRGHWIARSVADD
jgi:hypothetical protein